MIYAPFADAIDLTVNVTSKLVSLQEGILISLHPFAPKSVLLVILEELSSLSNLFLCLKKIIVLTFILVLTADLQQ